LDAAFAQARKLVSQPDQPYEFREDKEANDVQHLSEDDDSSRRMFFVSAAIRRTFCRNAPYNSIEKRFAKRFPDFGQTG